MGQKKERQEKIKKQLANVLTETSFDGLGERYIGKVRDCYGSGKQRYLITSDRISCFDRVLSTVPYKGQVLTQLALYWFEKTKDVWPNHLIDAPDPNVMLVKDCEVVPLEMVVRGYLAGSAWRDYEAGKDISGIKLPAGIKNHCKFPEPLITPSTKAADGDHDLPISEKDLLQQEIVAPEIWQQMKEAALKLFSYGQKLAAEQGLILVDTKYEFGIYEGQLLVVDEIHTLDCSRYWLAETYEERFQAGLAPQMLDKENMRQWLLDRGFKGDGEPPEITDDYRVEMSELYLDSYKKITGQELEIDNRNLVERIGENLGLG